MDPPPGLEVPLQTVGVYESIRYDSDMVHRVFSRGVVCRM